MSTEATDEPATGWRFWRVRDGRLTGLSRAVAQRQTWSPGDNIATTTCARDASHEPPAPRCLCGMYVLPTLDDALEYLVRTTAPGQGRKLTHPVAIGPVLTWGPALAPVPLPYGDSSGTRRVGRARIVGPLHLWPNRRAERRALAAHYDVEVLDTRAGSFDHWVREVRAAHLDDEQVAS